MQRFISKFMVGIVTLAAVSGYAVADELDILKAEVELMSERISLLESGDKDSAPGYVQKGTTELWLKLSGQLSRGILYADNQHDAQTFHVDNDGNPSQFRIEAGGRYNEKITIGVMSEFELESNSTSDIAFRQNEQGGGTDVLEDSKIEFWVKHEDYGALFFGQGLMASFLAGSVDLSGSDLAIYSAPACLAGGLRFHHKGAGIDNLGPKISQLFDDFNGLFRKDRIRYDSRVWNGAFISLSFADDRHHDIALRYAEMWNGVKVAGAIAYAESNRETGTGPNNEGFDIINGSFSILLPSGYSITLAAAQRDEEGSNEDKASMLYLKLGYLFNYFTFGQTAIGVDWYQNDDFFSIDNDDVAAGAAVGATPEQVAIRASNLLIDAGGQGGEDVVSTSYGFGVVQNIDKIATQVYLVIRNFDVDLGRSDAELDSIWVSMLGGRVKF